MTTNELFITATRKKLRFPTNKGNATTEDLWDLSLRELDTIFKALNAQVKQSNEESLLDTQTKSKDDIILDTKIAIVKHIFLVKKSEAEAAQTAAANAAQRQRIGEIIAAKEDAALQGKTVEELRALLDSLT